MYATNLILISTHTASGSRDFWHENSQNSGEKIARGLLFLLAC
jgi:hypothetical protein